MPKLNQVNAILTAKKPEAEKAISEIYKLVQKEAVFVGRSRNYRPYDEEKGSKLPPENQKVQYRAADLVGKACRIWDEIWSLTLTQDSGNQKAAADIVIDGVVVLANVPVTSLLYLDKQVKDLVTFVENLPTPDAAEDWTIDPNQRLLRGAATTSVKTSKEPVVVVKYPATVEHPAQTELFTKDVPIGEWTQVAFSGAMPAADRDAMLVRARKLHSAIKAAREQANLQEAEKKNALALFQFVFGPAVLD